MATRGDGVLPPHCETQMSNEFEANASLAATRRRQYGLLAIALLNLVIATTMDAVMWSPLFRRP
jgi:hypothetical protein